MDESRGARGARDEVAARMSAGAAAREAPRARGTVVAVHGVWMRGNAMRVLRRRLEAEGYDVHVFSYPSISAGLRENARRLVA